MANLVVIVEETETMEIMELVMGMEVDDNATAAPVEANRRNSKKRCLDEAEGDEDEEEAPVHLSLRKMSKWSACQIGSGAARPNVTDDEEEVRALIHKVHLVRSWTAAVLAWGAMRKEAQQREYDEFVAVARAARDSHSN